VTLTGTDLSISFGANGITSLLTETGVSGTGKPTTNFGDGWYALGIDTTGGSGPVFWEPFFRLFGSSTGDTTVTGPYTTAGTDAYAVYHAEGQLGTLLNADIDGSGAVNSKDLTYTVAAKGDSVGAGLQGSYPAFQLFAGSAAPAPVSATLITQSEVQALLPAAIVAWQAAGLDAADVRKLESVPVEVTNLGTTILGLEADGVITINQTAAGVNWYVNAGSGSNQAFGLAAPGGESLAGQSSPAANDVDLLTVLEHELGHVIGLADNAEAGDLMDITLGSGERREPTSADVAAVVSTASTAVTVPAAAVVGWVGQGNTSVGVVNASVDVTAVDPQSLSSVPFGPVSQATVDAAIASMLSPADGIGNAQISPGINRCAIRLGGKSPGLKVTNRRSGRMTPSSPRYPNGTPSSRFASELIDASIKENRPERTARLS
jgi:hypothetical protein